VVVAVVDSMRYISPRDTDQLNTRYVNLRPSNLRRKYVRISVSPYLT
jgi:hypothetical protein